MTVTVQTVILTRVGEAEQVKIILTVWRSTKFHLVWGDELAVFHFDEYMINFNTCMDK